MNLECPPQHCPRSKLKKAFRAVKFYKSWQYFKVPVTYFYRTQSVQLQSSEAAKQWLQHIRTSSFNAKPTIATNATDEVDPDTKKRIAQALAQMKQNGEISDDE